MSTVELSQVVQNSASDTRWGKLQKFNCKIDKSMCWRTVSDRYWEMSRWNQRRKVIGASLENAARTRYSTA